MEKLEATFKIITPMFLSGANQQKTEDGIRPPSVKGTLRFWWRALNWEKFRSKATSDEEALKLLHQEESCLFGASANNEGQGQGCFLLNICHNVLSTTEKDTEHPEFKQQQNDAARYLGYGLMVAFNNKKKMLKAGQLERGCINENQTFTVNLIFKGTVIQSVRDALIVMGMIGGLGSRARHGMGSIALQQIYENGENIWNIPQTVDEYIAELKRILKTSCTIQNFPPFSAFSKHTRVDKLFKANNPYQILNLFGKAMLMYRSAGYHGKILGENSEGRFQEDHDWFREDTFRSKNPDFHPRRVVFGLPHNYDARKPRDVVTPAEHERRSSPLLFHVHQVGNQFIGLGIFIKSQFLPLNEKINAGGKKVPANIEWSIITDFLDGLVGNPAKLGAALRFPEKEEVIA